MNLPSPITISYPADLPVSQRREDIARAISEHQVVIVAGETGSGKTTQIPKICLELGRERIGHTQPRRIAARSIAERVADELGVELGGVVGYQVRFDDRATRATRIKLMTDGVLLAEINRDRELRRYDTIILDEAHERSLTIDFLIGYLAQLLPRRPDLKLIVTSATIDPESFSRHFGGAPIVEVSGRTYPVEVRYRPLIGEAPQDEEGDPSPDRDYLEGIADALDELEGEAPGDVLVFLSGEAEIRDAQDALGGRAGTEIVPLYGRLSAADQHRVFDTRRAPGVRRRVVLATNVAETSLTVPGIKYVVDAGTARISRYSTRAKVQRLPIEAISRASANQRSGRAGRTSDGIAIRLYSEEDFERRPPFTDPEILRTDLAAVILQMMTLGLGDIAAFPFLQPPDSRRVKDGVDLLRELGAIGPARPARRPARVEERPTLSDAARSGAPQPAGREELTAIGRQLGQLPVDVRFGRMLIEAGRNGVVREVAAIVAGLSIQDPRERPLERRAQADQSHARFTDPTSDFLAILRLWDYLEERQRELSGNAFRRACRAEYLNYLRVREWQDLYRQILRAAKPLKLVAGDPRIDQDAIHRSLLAGLLSRIGIRDREKRDYLGARGQRFVVFPGSGLARKTPEVLMAAELVETSRLFARTVAAIDPAWAEALAGDLVSRSFSEPHWEKKQGSAVAFERVTLFGLPIVVRRRVRLGRIDPEQARELFIRHALVEGDWPFPLRGALYGFDRDNRALRAELEELEERTRRRDILVDDEAIVEFYDRRIPPTVTDVRAFERWWKDTSRDEPALLTMSRADLLDEEDAVDEAAFPSFWQQGEHALPVRYRFEPGAVDDGVTVEIPVALLAGIEPAGFDWQVPGMREELVTALLRALPKPLRRSVVPAGDWARRLLPELGEPGAQSLVEALAARIRAITHATITPADFDLDRLAPNLRITFAAVDGDRRLELSKDLAELRARFAQTTRERVAKAVAVTMPGRDLERSGLTGWDLDDPLPEMLEAKGVRGYPALVDERNSAAIRVFATAAEAERAHRLGVRRLLALSVPNPLGYVQEHLTAAEKLALASGPAPSIAALLDDALLAAIDAIAGTRAPRDRAGFDVVRAEVSAALLDGLFATVALVAKVLIAARDVDLAISAASSVALVGPLTDARRQLDALVHPGFVRIAGTTRLRRLPVYLAGLLHRVTRLAENPGRDRTWQNEVEQAENLYLDSGGTLPLTDSTEPRLVEVRWMLEELRLSLFAQHLGTAGPVSVQRIRKTLGMMGG